MMNTGANMVSPMDARHMLEQGSAVLVDVREPDEYVRRHIAGALSRPLSQWNDERARDVAGRDVIFTCRSGMRTSAACDRLAGAVQGSAFILDGGIDGWEKAGFPVEENHAAPLELMRQVQIVAGLLILAGILLGYSLGPLWFLVSGFVGAGLLFAGATGFCGMAKLLMLAPWNRQTLA